MSWINYVIFDKQNYESYYAAQKNYRSNSPTNLLEFVSWIFGDIITAHILHGLSTFKIARFLEKFKGI